MGLDAWTEGVARLITLCLQLIGLTACVGVVIHAAHMILSGALGGSGRVTADAVTHVIGALLGLALALSAGRIVEALLASMAAGALFG